MEPRAPVPVPAPEIVTEREEGMETGATRVETCPSAVAVEFAVRE